MLNDKSEDVEIIKKRWDEHAESYDEWQRTFEGRVEHYVDLELLKRHLPKNKDAKILDAAGGTGRITVPLAKMGYSVTICDISPGMLDVARKKLLEEGVSDKVEISECNACNMPFLDESFDFVICYGGGIKAASELVRVTKKKGIISMSIANRLGTAISKFRENPQHALALLTSKTDYDYYKDEKYRVIGEQEVRELLDKEGIRIIELYSYDILEALSIPKNVLDSHEWDEELFNQTTEIMLMLATEPSIRGISRYFTLFGEKI